MSSSRGSSYGRRRFLRHGSAMGAAGLLGLHHHSVHAEPPPETTKIRLVHAPGICLAPQYLAEEFLRMEGFKEVEYVKDWTTYTGKAVNENRADFTQDSAWTFLPSVESGGSAIALAGMHIRML